MELVLSQVISAGNPGALLCTLQINEPGGSEVLPQPFSASLYP